MEQSLSHSNGRQRQPPVARSQSIKILRNSSNSHHRGFASDESARKAWEEDVSQLEQQYESATLQMYCRITDYRMKNSFYYTNATTTGNTIPPPNTVHGLPLPSTLTMHNNANDTEESSSTSATYISEENGAIFEMDL